jgi:2'-5' RNA ligase
VLPNWFIALPVEAGAWLSALTPPPAVRLFGQHDLHLTVAFLGGVSAEQAHAAFQLAVTFPLRALHAELADVVPLGPARRASAFSALIGRGRSEVARDAMFEAAGARRETRPALAHVTLARPQRKASAEQVAAGIEWARGLDLGAPLVRIGKIALYTWSADRSQRLFRIERELPLSESNSASETAVD